MLAKGKAPIGVAVPEALGFHRCHKAGAGCQHSRGETPEKARNQARKGKGVIWQFLYWIAGKNR
jgi:hypothetical protein